MVELDDAVLPGVNQGVRAIHASTPVLMDMSLARSRAYVAEDKGLVEITLGCSCGRAPGPTWTCARCQKHPPDRESERWEYKGTRGRHLLIIVDQRRGR